MSPFGRKYWTRTEVSRLVYTNGRRLTTGNGPRRAPRAAEVTTMSWRTDEYEPLSTEEAFGKLTVDHLKPLLRLLTDDVPTRKGELVAALVKAMRRPEQVR